MPAVTTGAVQVLLEAANSPSDRGRDFAIVEAMEVSVECLSASVPWEGGKQTQRASLL